MTIRPYGANEIQIENVIIRSRKYALELAAQLVTTADMVWPAPTGKEEREEPPRDIEKKRGAKS